MSLSHVLFSPELCDKLDDAGLILALPMAPSFSCCPGAGAAVGPSGCIPDEALTVDGGKPGLAAVKSEPAKQSAPMSPVSSRMFLKVMFPFVCTLLLICQEELDRAAAAS